MQVLDVSTLYNQRTVVGHEDVGTDQAHVQSTLPSKSPDNNRERQIIYLSWVRVSLDAEAGAMAGGAQGVVPSQKALNSGKQTLDF